MSLFQAVIIFETLHPDLAGELRRRIDFPDSEAALDGGAEAIKVGSLKADENGKLRDKEAEAAIREYEERYGIRVDRNDADQIGLVLQGVRDEHVRLRRANQDLAADNERDRRLAIDMGADPASIPTTVQSLNGSEAGKRSVNAATAALDRDDLKQSVIAAKGFDAADTAFAMDNRSSDDSGFDDVAQVSLPAAPSPRGSGTIDTEPSRNAAPLKPM